MKTTVFLLSYLNAVLCQVFTLVFLSFYSKLLFVKFYVAFYEFTNLCNHVYTVTWGNPHAEWNKLSRTYQTVMRRFWYVNYTHNPNSKSEAGTQFIRKYHAWHTWETAAKWLINLKSTVSQNQILHYPPPPNLRFLKCLFEQSLRVSCDFDFKSCKWGLREQHTRLL